MGGDQQVMIADRRARPLKLGSDFAVDAIDRHTERHHHQRRQGVLDAPGQSFRALPDGSVSKLGRRDDARADAVCPDERDALSD